jgi:hypothetical protein
MPGCLRKSPSSMSHRQQSFCFILSLPLLLFKETRQIPGHTHADVALRRRFAINYRWRRRPRACEPFTAGAGRVWTDCRVFCLRTSAALSTEAQKSANNNLSTKRSGLLRSLLSIWRARARHLFSAASIAAFSVASRPSNSTDTVRFDISEPSV